MLKRPKEGKVLPIAQGREPIQVLDYFRVDLDNIRDFLSISERIWTEEYFKYEESLQSDSFELAERFDFRLDLSFTGLFPQLERKFLVVSIYTMFEKFLDSFVKSLARGNDIKEVTVDKGKLKNIYGGSDIACRFKYLKSEKNKKNEDGLGLKIDETDSWKEIDNNIREIRNILTHQNGYIDDLVEYEKQKESVVKYISDSCHVHLESYAMSKMDKERSEIVIEKTFITHFIDVLKKFNKELEFALLEYGDCKYLKELFQKPSKIYQIAAIRRACAMIKFKCEEKNLPLPNLPILSEVPENLEDEFKNVINILKSLRQND